LRYGFQTLRCLFNVLKLFLENELPQVVHSFDNREEASEKTSEDWFGVRVAYVRDHSGEASDLPESFGDAEGIS
jgi:hypothetical protein